MVIAVNTRILSGNQGSYASFIREIFILISRKQPALQLYFLSDQSSDIASDLPLNIHPLVVGPKADSQLLMRYWFDLRLPKIFKKVNADLFISPDGFCSLTAKLPQLLFLPEGQYSDDTGTAKNQRVPRNMSRFLNKVQMAITLSEFAKRQIMEKYKISEENVTVIHPAPRNIFHATEPAIQAEVKLQYTEGNEFFLFVGLDEKNHLVNLLKAFSIFKKRQQSSMKLVLVVQSTKSNSIAELIQTYKYRDEVIIVNSTNDTELAKLMSTAYAMIHLFPGFTIRMLEAMKCEIPVLAIADPAVREIVNDAALYFDATDHRDLGEKLMLIYKDEEIRDRLIGNGKIIEEKYTMTKAADLLWQTIEKALPGSIH